MLARGGRGNVDKPMALGRALHIKKPAEDFDIYCGQRNISTHSIVLRMIAKHRSSDFAERLGLVPLMRRNDIFTCPLVYDVCVCVCVWALKVAVLTRWVIYFVARCAHMLSRRLSRMLAHANLGIRMPAIVPRVPAVVPMAVLMVVPIVVTMFVPMVVPRFQIH